MVEIPPYLRPVSLSSDRKSTEGVGSARRAGKTATASGYRGASTTTRQELDTVVVSLESHLRKASARGNLPQPEEARQALQELREALPREGQAVGDLHEFDDRSRFISLLAPLVDEY
ncbi:MAG: hypothetical protein KQJ78_02070 [Deltaproteobacteria bacterium]|nr:hypothetical protein [Deltaproteobacteria bacterium]